MEHFTSQQLFMDPPVNRFQLYSCFFAVNRLNRVSQLAQFASTVEIHVTRVSVDPVTNAAAFVIHSEVLNLVSMLLQCLAQLEYVRL